MQKFDNEKLRALRLERGETLEAVAAATGLTKAGLSLVETGANDPRLDTILRLSLHFGHPLEFFLTDGATTVAPQDSASQQA